MGPTSGSYCSSRPDLLSQFRRVVGVAFFEKNATDYEPLLDPTFIQYTVENCVQTSTDPSVSAT